MAEPQPTKPEVDEEVAVEAKGAEDRKAAVALSALDASADDESSSKSNVDLDAMKKAMDRLAGTGAGATNGAVKKKEEKAVVKKVVKVDAADVATVVSDCCCDSVCQRVERRGLACLPSAQQLCF